MTDLLTCVKNPSDGEVLSLCDEIEEFSVEDLKKRSQTPTYEGFKVLGGLRLVVQEWPKTWPGKVAKKDDGNEFVSWLVTRRSDSPDGDRTEPGLLPFGEKTLEVLIKSLNLPLSYPNDLLGLFGLPLRLQDVHDDKGKTYLGILSSILMALSS